MRLVLASLCLCATLSAQSFVTVPGGYENAEANSCPRVAGLGHSGANQFILGASHLSGLVNRHLSRLSFRRDGGFPIPYPAGNARLTVRLDHAAFAPHEVARDFALNAPSPQTVFDGVVALPASGSVSTPLAWASPHVVEIPFATPFLYQGGPLAIEILGTNLEQAPFWWTVDGVEDDLRGSVVDEGFACGPRSGPNQVTASVAENSLVPGGNAEFLLFGSQGDPAFLLLGAGTFPVPLSLAVLGAPGCELRVDPFLALPAAVVDSGQAGLGGLARLLLPIPSQPAFHGGQLVAQWLELGPSVASSQTLRFTLAARLAALELVSLERHQDGSVEVHPRVAPVFGLSWF